MHQKRQAARVYAVMDISAGDAVAQVAALATEAMRVEVVGALSRGLVQRIGLRPGELRLV